MGPSLLASGCLSEHRSRPAGLQAGSETLVVVTEVIHVRERGWGLDCIFGITSLVLAMEQGVGPADRTEWLGPVPPALCP